MKIYDEKALSFIFIFHGYYKDGDWDDNVRQELIDFYEYKDELP